MPNERGPVLVIDDDQWILRSTAMVLEAEGLEVLTAASGPEGLIVASEKRPAVILLDIMMPGINGWETLERLKVDPATSEIPVVIFSARDVPSGKSVSKEKGADNFVRKPFEPLQLVEVVKRHVAAAQASLSTSPAVSTKLN